MWEMINNRRVICGVDKINEIPGIIQWYGLKKVFFAVYNRNAPICNTICKLLMESGLEFVIYDAIQSEPDLHMINLGRDLFVESNCDCTLAIGGGSVIDTAKAIGMLAINGGLVEEYQMNGKEVRKTPPLYIAVPTTAGTGAEATKVSVVKNNYNGLKKSLYHTTMIADITILDPALSTGLNAKITAATGIDALSHAIESYVSLNANPLTEIYGIKAIELIHGALEIACKDPNNLKARGDMLLASYLGGCAISAGIGIAHIMAQPIGAMYDIPHGDACSIFLPLSMEYNLEHSQVKYAKIAFALGVGNSENSDIENGKTAIAEIKRLRSAINAPDSLVPYLGDEKPDLDQVVETIRRTTGHIVCNPRPVNQETYRNMFLAAC